MILASEKLRELPAPSIAYGIGTFLLLSFLLYLTLLIDKD